MPEPARAPVHPGHRVLALFPFLDEEPRLEALASRFRPGLVDHVLAVDDGSTDGGADILKRHGIEVLRQAHAGLGACIKQGAGLARERGFDILVVLAGNGKDDPAQIPRLLAPILEREADYVQGSRFLEGGSSPHLPRFRRFSIRLLSRLFQAYAGRPCTDITNGFRAYKLSLLDDPRIDVWQDWLDTYEYEYYVHFKAYTLGYAVEEVPVTKTYPADPRQPYTKIRPVTGWWRMLRPLLFLALRLRR